MKSITKSKLIIKKEGFKSLFFKISYKLIKTILPKKVRAKLKPILLQQTKLDLLIDPSISIFIESKIGQSKQALTTINQVVLQSFLASNSSLYLPTCNHPEVSVILVLFNRAELTLACLRSLAENFHESMEVIIVDNASSDSTGILLERIQGAKIIRNSENLHFPAGVNQAAKEAKGKYILLLNNDAQLLTGSLTSVINTIKTSNDIGAVGGKIILLDGSLQEAGSIIWQDGSCLGYGRGDNPFAPMYMFQRDVDFCSGAFLLTDKELFLSFGGFDKDYTPAYYEETDYCFKLWQMGKRIVYDPNAVILHYEFASPRPKESSLELQASRQKIFVDKHSDKIQSHYLPSEANILLGRTKRVSVKRTLFIDDRVPHHFLGSGFPRANKILSGLVEIGHFVTFYSLQQVNEDWHSVYTDIPKQVEVIVGEQYGILGLEQFLKQRSDYYDFIIISRPHNMKIVNPIFKKNPELLKHTKLIYDAEAIVALREVEFCRLNGTQISEQQLKRMLKEELELANEADLILSVSNGESQKFVENGFERVKILGHSIAVKPTQETFENRKHILFVGAIHENYSPNADSVLWFAEKVLPEINKSMDSDIKFIIVGLNKSSLVAKLMSEQVVIKGIVDNLDTFYNTSRIFVAPTRFAAGISLKVYEAAAKGIPVISTSLIASQLGWKHGEELLVADSPEEFAKSCVRLYCDSVLWETLRINAIRRVQVDCSKQLFVENLKNILLSGNSE